MLKFLKNIFAKKEVEIEKLSLNELNAWLTNKTKFIFEDIDNKIKEIKSFVEKEKNNCFENLESLDKAELNNPKIPIRAKQAMEGNRASYIKKVKLFLDQIELNENNYDKLLEYCNEFNNQLENLAKNTFKSYQIIQEFFANESSNVSANIKKLDDSIKELKNSIINSDINKVDNIKLKISDLKIKIERKNNLKKELIDEENNLNDLKKFKENKDKEIDNFKNSEQYSNHKNLLIKKDSILKQIDEHNDIMLHSFSVLEKAFKKYERIAYENKNLVKNYLNIPIKTLIRDENLNILNILGKLKSNLEDGKLELDEKKKQKSLNEVKKLDKDFINDFRKKHNELKEKNNKMDKDLEIDKIEEKNDELNKEIIGINSKIDDLTQKNKNLKEEFEKIDIEDLRSKLQSKINRLLNKNVVLT